MGLEKTCDVRFGGKTVAAAAQLEPAELRIHGPVRLAIPAADIRSAEARAGVLHVQWPGGTVELLLGRDAEKWALKIRYPKGRLDKLGIKAGMRVAILGLDDREFVKEVQERTADVSLRQAKKDSDVVVVGQTKVGDLPRLRMLRSAIKKDGMIWVVWPKGRKEFREDEVRAYGPAAGLVDVKVMSFSDTLSGLKLVIPRKDR